MNEDGLWMRKLKEFCVKSTANATFMKQPFLPPFLFYLDFKQFSSACVDKLYTSAGWGVAQVFYIF